MYLTLATIPVYLANRGHLPRDQWRSESWTLSCAPGRNSNFLVGQSTGGGFFLKQIQRDSPEEIETQLNEVSTLSAIESLACFQSLGAIAPRLIEHDPARHVTVVQRVDGESLYEKHVVANSPIERADLIDLAQQAGERLAMMHHCGRDLLNECQDPHWPPRTVPTAVTLQAPASETASCRSCQSIVRRIRADHAFFARLQENQSHWRQETLVHGDLKWDNVLATRSGEIVLVDWELAILGDAAWDVAGMLQSYITFSIECSVSDSLSARADPVAGATRFWQSYVRHAEVNENDFAGRVRRLCAARLVQTALERAYHFKSIGPVEQSLLDLSRWMLLTPLPEKHLATERPGDG